MAHPSIELAEAIRARLASGSYTIAPPPTVARTCLPLRKREALADPAILVVPASRSIELESRTSDEDTLVTDVAVLRAVDPDDNAAMDAMLLLVHEVFERLRREDYAALPAHWIASANEPLFVQKYLAEERVFLSVVKVTHVMQLSA